MSWACWVWSGALGRAVLLQAKEGGALQDQSFPYEISLSLDFKLTEDHAGERLPVNRSQAEGEAV